MSAPERIGVVVSTYRKPAELALAVRGWAGQSDRDFILYVADDGSGEETRRVVASLSSEVPFPLVHVWQKDEGFRAARVRNLAIREAADRDYLIFTDGDCIPLPGLASVHRAKARAGSFLTGGRLLLSPDLTARLLTRAWPLEQESTASLLLRALRGEMNRALPLLLPPMAMPRTRSLRGIRTCHLSCWRADLEAVNGFDESYRGWGREDSDLAARLMHAGVARHNLRGMPVLHLWHREEDRSRLGTNDALLAECLRERRRRAVRGLVQLGAEA